MKISTVIKLGAIALFLIFVMGGCSTLVSFNNKEVNLRTSFEAKMQQRTAFYDKMYKTIAQKGQVAVKNDSSFYRNVNIIMEARKDAGDVFMKWITESNPNANYDQVSILYQDLSRSIEAERAGFFEEEKMIQDIVREHNSLLRTFPNSVWTKILGKQELIYKPITSSRTDEVIKTGKDDNINVF